jgi:integrase/recombinase XerD
VLDLRADFLTYCRLELGLAANTVAAYRRDLATLYGEAGPLAIDPSTAGPDEVARVLAVLRDEHDWAPSSRARLLVTWRMYLRFLVLEKHVARDRVQLSQAPTLWREVPEVLTVDEVDRLLVSVPPGPMELRDRAALYLLYACGARASEVVGIGLSAFSDGQALVRLRGKGNKERLVPLADSARLAVAAYVAELRPSLDPLHRVDALLLSSRGRPWHRQGLWALVRRAGELAGIDKPVYTHLLRHSFAVHMIERGADLRVVQELLGHANLTTTQRYTQADTSRLRDVLNRFHPRQGAVNSMLSDCSPSS